MDQPEIDVQLKVWKELAVSKQILMRTVTDALGLDSECGSDELKQAIAKVTAKAASAADDIKKAQRQADETVAAIEKKLIKSEKALAKAEAAKDKTQVTLETTEQRLTEARAAHAQELKKANAQLAEKQKAIKAINVALADTPENVVKKLKALKKEKLDEANERKRAENDARSLRKDKQQLEQKNQELKDTLEKSAKLAEQYRELHKLSQELEPQLKDDTSMPELPELDEELLASLEQHAETADDSDSKKKKKKKK